MKTNDPITADVSKVPAGYHLINPNQVQYVPASSANPESLSFNIAPNSVTEKIHYIYTKGTKGQSGYKRISAGSDTLSGNYDSDGNITDSTDTGLDSGYQLVNHTQNKFKFGDPSDCDVAVVPSTQSTKVYLIDSKTRNQVAVLTPAQLTNQDPSDSMAVKSLTNIPAGYHVADPDDMIPNDGKAHDVLLLPNKKTVQVSLTGAENPIRYNVSTETGAQIMPNSTYVPTGYHLNPNQTYTVLPDSLTTSFTLAPDTEYEVVNYYYHSNGKNILAGVDYEHGNYGTSGSVSSSNHPGLNSGYQLVKPDNDSANKFTFGTNGNVINVPVKPITNVTDIYLVNGKTGKQIGKLKTLSGNPSDSFTFGGGQIPASMGYHFTDPAETIYNDGNDHDIVVWPNEVTETINFTGAGVPNNSSTTISGDYGDMVSPATLNNIPDNFHVVNGQSDIKLDNQAHTISLAPNQSEDTIIYVDDDAGDNYGKELSSFITGAGNVTSKLANGDVVSAHLPQGYVDNNAATDQNITYDGLTHVIKVNGKSVHDSLTVNIYAKDANGKYLDHNGTPSESKVIYNTISQPINKVVGSKYVYHAYDFTNDAPSGYSPVNDDEQSGVINADGTLSNQTMSFEYDMSSVGSHAITVYLLNQNDHSLLNAGSYTDNTVGASVKLSDIVSVPKGYTLVNGTPTSFTVKNQPQFIDVYATGNKLNTLPSDECKINIVSEYKNGNHTKTSDVDLDLTKLPLKVGDTFTLNPRFFDRIVGYTLDPQTVPITETMTANGVPQKQITFVYDANNTNATVHFVNPDGTPTTLTTQNVPTLTGVDIIPSVTAPKGYHLVPGQVVDVPASSNGQTNVDVKVEPDAVVGTVKITLNYKNGLTGKINNSKTIPVSVSGHIGDKPITIYPLEYDWLRPGYKLTASDTAQQISFNANDVIKNGNTDTFRYDSNITFNYVDTPVDIQVQFVNTKDNNTVIKVNNKSDQDLGTIGIKGQMLDLKGQLYSDAQGKYANVMVGNKAYQLQIPAGFHLLNADNYIRVEPNVTPNQPNNPNKPSGLGAMPEMLLTLGVELGDDQPATPSGSNTATSSSASGSTSSSSSTSASPSNPSKSSSTSSQSSSSVNSNPSSANSSTSSYATSSNSSSASNASQSSSANSSTNSTSTSASGSASSNTSSTNSKASSSASSNGSSSASSASQSSSANSSTSSTSSNTSSSASSINGSASSSNSASSSTNNNQPSEAKITFNFVDDKTGNLISQYQISGNANSQFTSSDLNTSLTHMPNDYQTISISNVPAKYTNGDQEVTVRVQYDGGQVTPQSSGSSSNNTSNNTPQPTNYQPSNVPNIIPSNNQQSNGSDITNPSDVPSDTQVSDVPAEGNSSDSETIPNTSDVNVAPSSSLKSISKSFSKSLDPTTFAGNGTGSDTTTMTANNSNSGIQGSSNNELPKTGEQEQKTDAEILAALSISLLGFSFAVDRKRRKD